MISARKILTVTSIVGASLIFSSATFAQDSLPAAGTRPLKANIQGTNPPPGEVAQIRKELAASKAAEMRIAKENNAQELLMRRQNEQLKMEAKFATREANIQKMLAVREENIKLRIASQEAFLKVRDQRIVKLEQTLKLNMATREAALKAKLQEFKDKAKAQLTQTISQELNKINQDRTTLMTKNLTQLGDILTKISNKANEATPSANTPKIQSALDNANAVIQTAQTAVDSQAAKDYTVIVDTELTVRSNAQAKRDQLAADLKATQQKIIDAKQSVVNAYMILRSALAGGTTNGQ